MNNKLVLLDTSLRDGGYRNDFHFRPQDLEVLLPALEEAHLDYVEVGYRNGFPNASTHFGAAAWCPNDYLQLCHSYLKQSKMAVMAMPNHLCVEELDELKNCGVQLLRLYGIKNQLDAVLPFLQRTHDIGLEIAINLTFISNYSMNELTQTLSALKSSRPEVVYFADSNGSLLPQKVHNLFQVGQQNLLTLGFHAHDNLGLAQANTLAAIQGGAKFVDVTLAGMGKGIGNLKTEFFIAYLQALGIKKYALEPVVRASNYVREQFHIGAEPLALNEFEKAFPNTSL